MNRERKALLMQIMEIDFSLLETSLYLATHPDDEHALRLHNTLAKKSKELIKVYECNFGPLTNKGMSKFPWQYINSPWPWDEKF
ncbi:spore coat protein CotJB [Gottschalkia acidurici]|nr:spore coat protein CotJB [Gottschalkia acidurici]